MDTNRESSFTENVKRQDVYTESATEYILPDYNTDVRKILFTDARISEVSRFEGEEKVEFSGIVIYDVIYSDSDNQIASTSFTSDYDFSVGYESDREKIVSDTRVANFAIRLVGPRKFSVKASLLSSVSAITERSVGASYTADGGERLVTEKKQLNIRTAGLSEKLEREYAESLGHLDGASADEIRVIYNSAEAFTEEIRALEDAVEIKGYIKSMVVIENGEQPAYLIEKNIPFEERLSFEGVSSDMEFTPRISVISDKVNVNADEYGVEPVVSLIVEMSVMGEKNESVSLVSDAFFTDRESENSYTELCYSEMLRRFTLSEEQSVELTRENTDMTQPREVIFVSATPKIESCRVEDDRLLLFVDVKYNGIISEVNDDGSIGYYPIKSSASFEKNVNLDCQNCGKIVPEVQIKPKMTEAQIDSGKIILTTVLDVSVCAIAHKSERILSDISPRDEAVLERCSSVVSVYYPEPDESLFSIAKRFRTTPEKLADDNAIATSVASGGAEMTLPKRILIY